MRNIVKFEIIGGNLVISPRLDDQLDREELAEATDFLDVIEHQLCNGWAIIPPEEIGAMTSGLLLSEDTEYYDSGRVKSFGHVYWHKMYETVNELEELKAGRSVTFYRNDAELK